MEDSRCCVLVLCGIPGSGKTTFSRKIKDYIEKSKTSPLHIIHVCFDDLIPTNLDLNEGVLVEQCGSSSRNDRTFEMPYQMEIFSLCSNSEVTDEDKGKHLDSNDSSAFSSIVSPWKTYRNSIFTLISNLLTILKNGDNIKELMKAYENDTETETYSNCTTSFRQCSLEFVAMVTRPDRGCACFTNKKERDQQASHVILVDDNMYYRSMRYLYFQLARKYGVGFMQVYVDCDIEDAVEWNRCRQNPVPDEIVTKMAKKLEHPNPKIYPWERNSHTVYARNMVEQENLDQIVDGIHLAMSNPVPSLPVEDIEQKVKHSFES